MGIVPRVVHTGPQVSTVLVTFVIVREIVRPVIVRKLGLWCDPYPLPLDHSVRAPDPKTGFCFNRRSLNSIWTNCNSVKTFIFSKIRRRNVQEVSMLYRADVPIERGFSESCSPFLSQSLPVWIQSCDRNTETIFSEWVAYTFLEFRKIPDIIPVCLSLGHGVLIVHCTSDSVQSLSTCVTKR